MNNVLTVIVPMAGRGSRFTSQGWGVDKPFIPIKNKMMVERVLECLNIPCAKYLLIVRSEFLTTYRKELNTLTQKFSASIHAVRKVTMGAACTVLAARESFDAEGNYNF